MKKHYPVLISLTIFMAAFLALGSYACAQDDGQFNQQIQDLHAQRARMELKLGLDPNADTFPQATCYYDDLVDHYEHLYLRMDEIEKGI